MYDIHRQSVIRYVYNERQDALYPTHRRDHLALAVPCPRCGVNAGHQCKAANGTMMPTLAVHRERQEASL